MDLDWCVCIVTHLCLSVCVFLLVCVFVVVCVCTCVYTTHHACVLPLTLPTLVEVFISTEQDFPFSSDSSLHYRGIPGPSSELPPRPHRVNV